MSAARMTAEEFGLKHCADSVEYIDGRVTPVLTGGAMHGLVCNNAAFAIGRHIDASNAGRVFSSNTFVKVPTASDPERVYGPDVCFVPYTRMPKNAVVPDGILSVAPELVIEVFEPRDVRSDLIAKSLDYLNAGVSVVLILDPERSTASTYRNDESNPQEIFKAGDTLTLPDVLPGFAVAVARLFE